jgi:hypothetical protein
VSEEAPRYGELGWAIVELMGHRRLVGRCSEVQVAGATLLRVDVPANETLGDPEVSATQLYGGGAIYCITPTTEEAARKAAALARPSSFKRIEAAPATELCEREEYCELDAGHEGRCRSSIDVDADDDDDIVVEVGG